MNSSSAKVLDIGIDYVYDYYNTFLGTFGHHTARDYKSDLNFFFNKMYKKKPEHVTVSDITSITSNDMAKYSNYLSEEIYDEKTDSKKPRYKNNTCNRKIKSVKSFFTYLRKDKKFKELDLDLEIFDVVVRKNPELDAESWDGLSWDEVASICEYAHISFGEESKQLSMLFKLASITSIRIEALVNCTWEEHWFTKNERGIAINYIDVIDKGKPHIKSISPFFFDELQDKLGSTGRLFPSFHSEKVREKLQIILDALGFDERRNIKVHSFKKAGIIRTLEMTGGDMYKAQKQGNHTSMATTEKYYLQYKECLADMPSYTMDLKINVKEELSDYNRDEIVEAINQMSDSAKFELLRLLKK